MHSTGLRDFPFSGQIGRTSKTNSRSFETHQSVAYQGAIR
jgi:hypothetical protein